MPGLKPRANSLVALTENAAFYVAERPIAMDAKAKRLLGEEARAVLKALLGTLETLEPWEEDNIERSIREFARVGGVKLGAIAQPLRASLTGSTASPGIFEVIAVLGQAETVGRIRDALASGAERRKRSMNLI